ncbi:MAG: TetR/AcrR family transcriptional regulator [Chloroflexota bacterium]|nr:TetR/AcrR family transcriptional regulator [Chloroflexota bacterium]
MAAGRKLNLKARAARMAETRQRIVRAAYDLHRTVGPARTTISAIAGQAGVQRHTVYQHFPDELALSGACTEYGLALDPQPDPAVLAGIPDPEARLRAALAQQYGYYRRNESLLANVLRDAPLLQQRLQAAGLDWRAVPEAVRRFFEQPDRLQDALVPGWPVHGTSGSLLRAALGLAVDFGTWRTLTRDQGLDEEQAVELMVKLVVCAARMPESGVRRATDPKVALRRSAN